MNTKPRALSLISGGLDSMLATKIIMDQGIYVEGINFFTGFCGDGISHPIKKDQDENKPVMNASFVANCLGIKLNIVDVLEGYKNVVANPQYGYGANLNPCLDCKIFMINQAKLFCEKNNFDFIITGEVVGQRPKSQLKHMLPLVAKKSEANELLLRPLCAKLLSPTLPELNGWVNRELLYSISGRSRKSQIALAKSFGFEKYAQPSGGCCFLLDACYSKRLLDLWDTRNNKDYTLQDILLLKTGRHVRPKPHFKMIIGRNEEDNNFLNDYKQNFINLISTSHNGPFVLIDGILKDEDDINLAASITAHYCSHHNGEPVQILVKNQGQQDIVLSALPMEPEEIRNF